MTLLRALIVSIVGSMLAASAMHAIDPAPTGEETRAVQHMDTLNAELNRQAAINVQAAWTYDANLTDYNAQLRGEASAKNALFIKKVTEDLRAFDYAAYKDVDLKRKFHKLAKPGVAALPDDKYRELEAAITAMESNYAKVHVCDYRNTTRCDLQLEPELEVILERSRDPAELRYYWQQWYDRAGAPTRKDFDTYVRLANEASVMNNFTSRAEEWLDAYEDPLFEQQLEAVFDQVRPLYEQLHGYVRHKLLKQYGPEVVCPTGPIPMHLLRNMWGLTWENIIGDTIPYPKKQQLDVTDEMIRQNYTALKMFQMGDEFFQSLNMTKLPQEFWDKSIIEKPKDGRDLVCHASAWDFYTPNDVRIKQCTRISMDQLFTVHHELGHIQYFLQYQHQPNVYRDGANPGFHEAVGDVLTLSVSTPKHLQKIGLLAGYVEDDEAKINQLYRVAMLKIIFLPFAYTLDKYRWRIFRGQVPADKYNAEFWRLREEYSGIVPPVPRSETDFDAPAKYHVSADVEYLRYLVSFIVQFQFHKAACQLAGEYEAGNPLKPLSSCDIYQSAAAGNAIKAMLAMGASKPWPDAMEVLTGTRKMDASAILEYFQPLNDWLLKANKETGAPIGWKKGSVCNSMNSF